MCAQRIDYNQVLPIKTVLASLGYFFPLAICAYALYNEYQSNYILVIESILLFIVILLAFVSSAIKKYKELSEKEFHKDALSCYNCINSRMKEAFHDHGLLHLQDLLDYEGKLSLSSNPSECKVLVYTSDLATEKDAEKEAIENIAKGVQYIVLFYTSTCSDEEKEKIEQLYGAENLVDLSDKKFGNKYTDSIDGNLAETLGFDITVYQNEQGKIDGFFAVDFVPKNRPMRSCHKVDCKEKCNYGRKTEAFYKKISVNYTSHLYEEIMNIYRDFLRK